MVNLSGWITKWQFTKILSVILLGLTVVACSDTDGPPEDLFGVAATGAATQGTVFVVDADGVEISKPVNADGTFRFDVRKMTAPFMLKSVASNGLDPVLFSYAAEANVTVNITPLTNVAMFIANGSADLSILYDSWASAFGTITATAVKDAQATVNANLSTQYIAFSLNPFTYDFIGTRFLTNNTGIDALLNVMTVDLSAGISIYITGIVNVLPFDLNIDTTGYDIGGISAATTGAYTLTLGVTVDGASSGVYYLSINLPASAVPTDVSYQMVEDMFVSYYGAEGTIVINSVTVTADAVTPTTTIAVLDASITRPDATVDNYIATYTYTLNP